MSQASRGTSLPKISRALDPRRGYASVGDFLALMKPRVMSLIMSTALAGLWIAPGRLDPGRGFVAIRCIALDTGGAAVLNIRCDADVDALMTRGARRPIPSGGVSRAEALIFGLMLATGTTVVLGSMLNMVAAALLAFTIFLYVVVYTTRRKRRTPQNTVIGGPPARFLR